MIKLSELENDDIVMDENLSIWDVECVRENIKKDLFGWKSKKIYTTTRYYAKIDALYMLESAIEKEYENNMYEDWDERIEADITSMDIEKLQNILDEILSRNKEQNTSYFQGEKIEVDYER